MNCAEESLKLHLSAKVMAFRLWAGAAPASKLETPKKGTLQNEKFCNVPFLRFLLSQKDTTSGLAPWEGLASSTFITGPLPL